MSIEHDTWSVERSLPHPPARVFAAWADPAVKVRWFDLTDGADYSGDFRVGGTEVLRAGRFVYIGHYRDIVPDSRIVLTYEVSVDGRLASVSVATVHFGATPAGTRLVYTEQGAYLDGLDDPRSRRAGVESQLDRLSKEPT